MSGPPIFHEPRADSEIEALLAVQMRALKFAPWKRNFRFLEERKFELDFAWPDWHFGVEVDGHVHRIRERFNSDLEKHALAQLAGWTIMRVGGRDIRNGRAVRWVDQMLARVA